jgi:FtsP/CotA-like multicopper oxidase with cupredoxin domain
VCVKDIVVVDVTNHMEGLSASIHWHGLKQMGSIFNDGVPFLTQCPIQSGNTFRYSFEVNDPGTNFYHSHSGLQKANGLYGPFIVRIPDDSKLYDYDPTQFHMVISDW